MPIAAGKPPANHLGLIFPITWDLCATDHAFPSFYFQYMHTWHEQDTRRSAVIRLSEGRGRSQNATTKKRSVPGGGWKVDTFPLMEGVERHSSRIFSTDIIPLQVDKQHTSHSLARVTFREHTYFRNYGWQNKAALTHISRKGISTSWKLKIRKSNDGTVSPATDYLIFHCRV